MKHLLEKIETLAQDLGPVPPETLRVWEQMLQLKKQAQDITADLAVAPIATDTAAEMTSVMDRLFLLNVNALRLLQALEELQKKEEAFA